MKNAIPTLFLAFGLFLFSCNGGNGTNGNGGPYDLTGTATLENQEEHSGIGVEILEADTFVLTDETGHYELPPLPDGDYTLNFVFPYYGNERCTITVETGMTPEKIPDVELEQLLEFLIEINDTVFYEGDTIRYTCKATNISSIPVPVWWFKAPAWIEMYLLDSTLIWASCGFYAVEVVDTLFSGEADSLPWSWGWVGVVGKEGTKFGPGVTGELYIITGVATNTIVGNEIIVVKDVYFPWADSSGYILSDYLIKKLPVAHGRIEQD